MKVILAALFVLGAGEASALAVDRVWEFRGEFQQLKAGAPESLVVRLPDGRQLEVPLDALSESSQSTARQAAAEMSSPSGGADDEASAVTVRGPFGKAVRLTVPEIIKDVEMDAIHCGSAAEAADVYRLFLARDGLPADRRTAAETRQREWVAMADQGLVRLGERWVPPVEARAATDEATKLIDHALELMQLGNGDLAEEELRKASRTDPEGSRAPFIMGLAYALVARNPAKAVEHFMDAMRRAADDPAVLANLAVLEVYTRRYATLADHFRGALETAGDPVPVADNIAWAVKLAGDAKANPAYARSRMPDKTVDELNTLYRTLTQDFEIKPAPNATAPRFLGPDGLPCAASTLADVARQVQAAGASSNGVRRALGFVVAAGHVICPRSVVTAADGTPLLGISVTMPTDRGRRWTATVVAAPSDGDVALLACEDLKIQPLPLATAIPSSAEVAAVGRSGASWFDGRLAAARGKILTPALQIQARGRFVHTAVVPRGLGGGPIVDATGRVVGMVSPTPRTDASGNTAGFGIPVERIRAIVKEHLPGVEAAANAETGSDAAGVEPKAVAASVLVSAARERPAQAAGAMPGTPP